MPVHRLQPPLRAGGGRWSFLLINCPSRSVSQVDVFEVKSFFLFHFLSEVAVKTCHELLGIFPLHFSVAACPGHCPANPAPVLPPVYGMCLALDRSRAHGLTILLFPAAPLELPAILHYGSYLPRSRYKVRPESFPSFYQGNMQLSIMAEGTAGDLGIMGSFPFA